MFESPPMTAPKDGVRARPSAPPTSRPMPWAPVPASPRSRLTLSAVIRAKWTESTTSWTTLSSDTTTQRPRSTSHAGTSSANQSDCRSASCWAAKPAYRCRRSPRSTPGEPEEMRRRVADHRAKGYRGHSIKIGALDSEGGPALDAERIAACRQRARHRRLIHCIRRHRAPRRHRPCTPVEVHPRLRRHGDLPNGPIRDPRHDGGTIQPPTAPGLAST